MTTINDVPIDILIDRLSQKLEEDENIHQPGWSKFVKTGSHKEKPPTQENWWFIRAAAVLRTVHLKGPVGVSRLRGKYGGKKRKGTKPGKATKGGGKIIRVCLQQLENASLIKKLDEEGRITTPKGQRLLNATAHEILKELVVDNPAFGKY